MTKKQCQKIADKIGYNVSRTSAMEEVENNNAKWRVHRPGWSGGSFFDTLPEVYDYLTIEAIQ